MKKTLSEVLEGYVEKTEYVMYYNNVIICLDLLEIDYDIEEINDLSHTELKEASEQLTTVHKLLKYTLGE